MEGTTSAASEAELIATWQPRRSLAAIIGQVLLVIAAASIIGATAGDNLQLPSVGWLALLGLALAVLGANCLNLTYWYPIAWSTGAGVPQPPSHFESAEGERLLIRSLILLQFVGCGVVIAFQVIAAIAALLSASPQQDASPFTVFGGLGVILGALVALLGGIFDYILAQEARHIAWPWVVSAMGEPAESMRPAERTSWQIILDTGRETHKLVIGALVLFAYSALATGSKQALLFIVGALVLLFVGPMAWYTVMEVRHLLRARAQQA